MSLQYFNVTKRNCFNGEVIINSHVIKHKPGSDIEQYIRRVERSKTFKTKEIFFNFAKMFRWLNLDAI
jgi:hypothetical protein